jgi:hypothetical protein
MNQFSMNAVIENGQVIPAEPERLPAQGEAILTGLPEKVHQPDWSRIAPLLGGMTSDLDAAQWQQQERAQWDER